LESKTLGELQSVWTGNIWLWSAINEWIGDFRAIDIIGNKLRNDYLKVFQSGIWNLESEIEKAGRVFANLTGL
jgi:hypothetical protein